MVLRVPKNGKKHGRTFKYNLKRKAAANLRSINNTGGGPSSEIEFTSLELRVLDLLGQNFIGMGEHECGVSSNKVITQGHDEVSQPSCSSEKDVPGSGFPTSHLSENSVPLKTKSKKSEYEMYEKTLTVLKNIDDKLGTMNNTLTNLSGQLTIQNESLIKIIETFQETASGIQILLAGD